MKHIEVVAGVIINKDNKILCCQRKNKGELALKWEFPGGKIEQGETHNEALIRELNEELEIDVVIIRHLITVKHQYNLFHLTMHCYLIEEYSGNLVLNEHEDFKWLDKMELYQLEWAEADIPIVKKLEVL
ncbi:CTP pyrophosphohydrolase [Candidatus Izimaplasma bacterium HR1]|jgi:8-oxo-dGTP diphosphatase|uniref:8-oxo-dGTP diphosphatase MutT n=1 Tax=Candidatus Izimoplasma sp. HR1 TaxID=1541959 RepID=UPI0004F61C98|nr:CTP pyrophosphohydrolase [Candidatus Izimaplasma bacterium HR1]